VCVGHNHEPCANGWTDRGVVSPFVIWTRVDRVTIEGTGDPHLFGERGTFGDISPSVVKYGLSGVWSIFSTLFSRRQRRCGLSLFVLYQLVYGR